MPGSSDTSSKNFERLFESLIFTLGGCYFFTLGFIESLRIPESPTIEESGYYFFKSSLLSDSWAGFLLFFALLIVGMVRATRGKQGYPKWAGVAILLLPWIFIWALYFANELFGISLIAVSISRLYSAVCFFTVFFPVAFLVLLDMNVFHFELDEEWQKVLWTIALPCIGWAMSFNLSYSLSGDLLRFKDYKPSRDSAKIGKLLWKNGDSLYFAECESKKILGMKIDQLSQATPKEFFSEDIVDSRHSSICKHIVQ